MTRTITEIKRLFQTELNEEDTEKLEEILLSFLYGSYIELVEKAWKYDQLNK